MFWRRALGGAAQITPGEVQELLEKGESCVVLDVREEDEYSEGHVPGSVWIPLAELQQRMNELPKDQPIYALCHSGARSAMATRLLNAQGYQAKNIAGGIIKWTGELEA